MQLSPDDFPDSPYARVLREGREAGLFEEPLEAEYRRAHVLRVRRRVRAVFTASSLLGAWFTFDHVRRMGAGDPLTLLHFGVLLPCLGAILWLIWSRHYEAYYLRVARFLVPVLWSLIAIFSAQDLVEGRGEALAGLSVNVIALFFFTGLMFRQALVAGSAMLVVFVLASRHVGLDHAVLIRAMAVLGLTAVIGAIVGADVETSYRRTFLEAALVRQLAARDGLTGLMNRRAFDQHLERVWQHAVRDQRNIAVMMIDIDLFKRYNDTRGHQAGDEALRRVAQVVGSFAKRPLDLAARYGGEEFAVILYDLTESGVADLAERLRQAVADGGSRSSDDGAMGGDGLTVSVGAGIAAPSIGRTSEGAVQLADEALYEAKENGRNRVVVRGVDAYGILHTGDFVSPSRLRRPS